MNEEDEFSGPLRIVGKDGAEIKDFDDWHIHARPAGGERQWRKGRSAYEIASAWTGTGEPAPPDEVIDRLENCPLTASIEFGRAQPEARIRLDQFRGNTRNADLLAFGTSRSGSVLLSIEAKVDESFGRTIEKELAGLPAGSRKPDRIERLCQILFGSGATGDSRLLTLRYQLLHGLGSTAIEAAAQKADVAVFLVHVFAAGADDRRLARNDQAFDEFVAALDTSACGSLTEVHPRARDSPLPRHLLIGKLTT